jgi:ubiquinone/menaquinone biosynthesis C-methylase UbiE
VSPEIKSRYGALASESANLSCGTAATTAEAQPGQVCIDLGCGRGRDALYLSSLVGIAGHVYGLDGSPKMIDASRQRAAELGLTNVTFIESPIDALALPTAMADWVVSNCALNHASDKARVWREIHRVLKPGGRFAVSDIYAVEPIAAQYRDDPAAVAECWAGAETRPEYLAHVAEAGFEDIEVRAERAPYRKEQALLSSFTLRGRKPARALDGAELESRR